MQRISGRLRASAVAQSFLSGIWLLFTVLVLAQGAAARLNKGFEAQWSQFKDRFVAADGRVIDTGNKGVSHSEGQGYGMLFALHAGDRATFDRIWQWTTTQLQTRSDHLFMWKRRLSTPLGEEDKNNASDGDILITWALLSAADQWDEPRYRQAGSRTLSDIRQELVHDWKGRPVLLPGKEGFSHGDVYTVNLSYWIYPALEYFSRYHPDDPVWPKLIAHGLELLAKARFGRWGLPPDWLSLDEGPSLETHRAPVFGYNAVRIPVHLIWSRLADGNVLRPYLDFWGTFSEFTPAWTNLRDDCIDSYDAPAGIRNIRSLVAFYGGHSDSFRPIPIGSADDYYSASLTLLTQLAAGRP